MDSELLRRQPFALSFNFGRHYPGRFKWEDGILTWYDWDYPPPGSKRVGCYHYGICRYGLSPTADQWLEFWQICAELNVWSWPTWVGHRHIFDGAPYDLLLYHGDASKPTIASSYDTNPQTAAASARCLKVLTVVCAPLSWRG